MCQPIVQDTKKRKEVETHIQSAVVWMKYTFVGLSKYLGSKNRLTTVQQLKVQCHFQW